MTSRALHVFLAAVTVVLTFWAFLPEGWRDDGPPDYVEAYAPLARGLLQGEPPNLPDGSKYPTGYPALLAGLFQLARWTHTPESLWVGTFAFVAMGLTALFLYRLARRVLVERVAFLATALWLICPFTLWLTRAPNVEIAFLPFLHAALWQASRMLWQPGSARPRVALLVGLFSGVAALMRPSAMGLGLVLAAAFLALRFRRGFRRKAVVLAAVILLANGVLVAPWGFWAGLHIFGGTQMPEGAWMLGVQVAYGLAALAGAVRLWLRDRRGREWLVLAGATAGYFVTLSLLGLSDVLWLVPVLGLVAVAAAGVLERRRPVSIRVLEPAGG